MAVEGAPVPAFTLDMSRRAWAIPDLVWCEGGREEVEGVPFPLMTLLEPAELKFGGASGLEWRVLASRNPKEPASKCVSKLEERRGA